MRRSSILFFVLFCGGLSLTGEVRAGKKLFPALPEIIATGEENVPLSPPRRSTSRFAFASDESEEYGEETQEGDQFHRLDEVLASLEGENRDEGKVSRADVINLCEDFSQELMEGDLDFLRPDHLSRLMKVLGGFEKRPKVAFFVRDIFFQRPDFYHFFYENAFQFLEEDAFNVFDLLDFLEGHGRLKMGVPPDLYEGMMEQINGQLYFHALPCQSLVDLVNIHSKWGVFLPWGTQSLWENDVHQRLQYHGFTGTQLVKLYSLYARMDRPLPAAVNALFAASLEKKMKTLAPQNLFNLFYAQALRGISDVTVLKACQKNIRSYLPGELRLLRLAATSLGYDLTEGLLEEDKAFLHERTLNFQWVKNKKFHGVVQKILHEMQKKGHIQEVQKDVVLDDFVKIVHFYAPHERVVVHALSPYHSLQGTSFRLENKIATLKGYRLVCLSPVGMDFKEVLRKVFIAPPYPK